MDMQFRTWLASLLIGHMDTVFEPSSPFQKFVRDGDTAVGPGTSDMKGGITA
jgi:glutamate carboxypeptidase